MAKSQLSLLDGLRVAAAALATGVIRELTSMKKYLLKYPLFVLTIAVFSIGIYEVLRVSEAISKTPDLRDRYLSENAIRIKLDDVPRNWVVNLLKIEDPNFYEHNGVDIITPGAGLTTIPQAISKYMYFDSFKPGFSKLEQTLIARFVVHTKFTKQEQLEIFYNSAYFGHHNGNEVRGFDEAAKVYFSKGFSELTDDEYLSLVAMLVSPNLLHVVRNPTGNALRVERLKNVLSGQYIPVGVTDIMYDKSA